MKAIFFLSLEKKTLWNRVSLPSQQNNSQRWTVPHAAIQIVLPHGFCQNVTHFHISASSTERNFVDKFYRFEPDPDHDLQCDIVN